MIDEKALKVALKGFVGVPLYIGFEAPLRFAIEAYLAAALLPGAGEPAGYIDGPRFDGETGKVREGGAHLFSSGRGLLHPVPLYTAAPDTAQAVAAEREACVLALQLLRPGSPPALWDRWDRGKDEGLSQGQLAIRQRGAKP